MCVEGLVCLLEEWGIELAPSILLIDNRSSLSLMRMGGSWRTRYFAVRAARIMEEHMRGNLNLRYCPTSAMGADGLTKMATAPVMKMLRDIQHGILPSLPEADAELAIHRLSPHSDEALVAHAAFGALPMTRQRREAEQIAYDVLERGSFVSDADLLSVLQSWGFAKNTHRPNVAPRGADYVFSECFGLIRDRTGRWMVSVVTSMFPSVAKVLNVWLRQRLVMLSDESFERPLQQWLWTSCTVNRGFAAARHRDGNNFGPSIARSFNGPRGDGLYYWPEHQSGPLEKLSQRKAMVLDIADPASMCAFDGRMPHQTRQGKGDLTRRYSIIFFTINKSWVAPPDVLHAVEDLGFILPTKRQRLRNSRPSSVHSVMEMNILPGLSIKVEGHVFRSSVLDILCSRSRVWSQSRALTTLSLSLSVIVKIGSMLGPRL